MRFVPVSPSGLGEHTEISGKQTGNKRYYEAGGSCFFLESVSGQTAGISFYELFRSRYREETLKVTCLKKVTLDSGVDRQTVFLDYEKRSVRMENNSFAAATASVIPVSEDAGFGKTVYSYFNGSSPSRFSYPKPDRYCNAAAYYTHFAGQVSSIVSFDGDHTKVSENHCYAKAFDSHGFCIQQTKLSKSDFVKRFSLTMCNSEKVWDEIKSSIEYEPKYYRRRRTIQRSIDKNGKEIAISQTVNYAFEAYPEMEKANILNDVLRVESKNDTEQVSLEAARYEYIKNDKGYYYQSAEYTMGRTEGSWLSVSSAAAVDAHCKTVCEINERGIPLKIRDGGIHVRFHAKSGGQILITADFGGGDVSEKAYLRQEGWVNCSLDFFAKTAKDSVTVNITGEDEIYIDALYFTPVSAQGEAFVYTGGLKLQTALHRACGPGSRTYFDRYDTPCIEAEDEGRLLSVNNTIYGERSGMNGMYTIKPVSESVWYDARQGYLKSSLLTPGKDCWNFLPSDHFALLFLAEKTMPAIMLGDTRLCCSGGDVEA